MKIQSKLSSDLKISRIITGLWQMADIEREEDIDPKAYAEKIIPYVEAGLTTFDMADHYGSSELIVGEYNINNSTSDVQLLTKWVPKPGKVDKQSVSDAVQLALDRMKQTSIDLMQYHAWHYPDPSWLDALFYLTELKQEGLIKNIGVTNFDAAHLRVACASGIPIVSNQISHSLIDQRANSSKIIDVCNEYGIKLLAYGVVMGGFLTNKWLNKNEPKPENLKTWSEMKYKRFIDESGGWDAYQNLLNVVNQIAQNNDVSIANICSRYILENPLVAGIIIGARLGENNHIKDNLNILKTKISKEEINLIRDAQKELNLIPGDCGDEYRKPPYLTASGDLSHHFQEIPKIYDSNILVEGREHVSSNTKWEELASYSRAVKYKDRIVVSGTTATYGDLTIGGDDASAQTYFIIDKIEAAINSLGGSLKDVIRTRIFIKNLSDWELVAKAHGERFKDIMPANTLVQARLIGDDYLVEIEAEAVIIKR
jgi:aryl-alcohol dehydrogenase-like predicted oxidoreductase/enamine deaminase RidA (YjgF/YER057c/UK114 family)